MIRNKKFWIAALLCLAAILGALGCGSKKDLAEPEISNITADVSERPSGIYLGDYVFSAAELDGRVLTQEEYVVRNKYFLFACEEYGAFGVGEHAAAISFEGREEPFRFTLTVTDTAPCRFEFPEVIGRKFEAESFSLALAKRKSATKPLISLIGWKLLREKWCEALKTLKRKPTIGNWSDWKRTNIFMLWMFCVVKI